MSDPACIGPQPTERVSPERVPPELIGRIVDVLHLEQVRLFGSRARSEARADSDWDSWRSCPTATQKKISITRSVWRRLRAPRLRRVELFTMTRSDLEAWRHSRGTLAELVASTRVVGYTDGVVVYALDAQRSPVCRALIWIREDHGVITVGD